MEEELEVVRSRRRVDGKEGEEVVGGEEEERVGTVRGDRGA